MVWTRQQMKMRTENASIDIVRVAAGVSDSGQKVSLSLSAYKHTDNESCAGGWGSMIDIEGAMAIIVDSCIMFFSRIEEQWTEFLRRMYGGIQYIQVVPQRCMFIN